jgi:hypothetical protein
MKKVWRTNREEMSVRMFHLPDHSTDFDEIW